MIGIYDEFLGLLMHDWRGVQLTRIQWKAKYSCLRAQASSGNPKAMQMISANFETRRAEYQWSDVLRECAFISGRWKCRDKRDLDAEVSA
ncbi:hypothetical protein [Aliamphritea ceti]|uniref:hypothetical protein n=1 Tax=Aliamphritea ceti TaxID=1524258 RepID=UPI0021C4ABBF|nr:hypothetical protein [Aliamphritea ceti]